MKKLLIFVCVLAVFGIAAQAWSEEARSVGYWKNHDIERELSIDAAAGLSTVFETDSSLRYFLSLKGKKTMLEKAKRQFAAMLLNVAASVESTTWLSQGELEIIQIMVAGYGTGTTISDAIIEIENSIITSTNLESAKDLAEEINNRELF